MSSEKASVLKVKRIPIELDKPRTLLYDMNAFIELEEMFGTVEDAMKAVASKKMKPMRAFLWAGLIHEDEGLTEKQVGAMLTMENMEGIINKLNAAMQSSMPEIDEKN